MKLLVLGFAAAALSVGMAAAGSAHLLGSPQGRIFPAGCTVPLAVAPGYLPRAGLIVENSRYEPMHLWLEGRDGSGLRRVDLGIIGGKERLIMAHALPAGRNILTARGESGRGFRTIFYVTNHGPDTCTRRYFWPIA